MLRDCHIIGTEISFAKINKDYFGRREPAIKANINNEEFLAIKEFTLKTCTSRFNMDLNANKS